MKSRLGSLTVCAVLALTAGCSGDDPGAGPDVPGSATPSGGASTTDEPSSQPSVEPSVEPSTPSVEPASGPDLSQKTLTVRAPQGWQLTREADPFTAQATDGLSAISVTEIEDFGDGLLSIREQAEIARDSGPYLQDPEILEPVEIDGLEWYHLAGPTDRVRHLDAFGTSVDGTSYSVDISLQRELVTPAQREQVVASVLASISIGPSSSGQ